MISMLLYELIVPWIISGPKASFQPDLPLLAHDFALPELLVGLKLTFSLVRAHNPLFCSSPSRSFEPSGHRAPWAYQSCSRSWNGNLRYHFIMWELGIFAFLERGTWKREPWHSENSGNHVRVRDQGRRPREGVRSLARRSSAGSRRDSGLPRPRRRRWTINRSIRGHD
jgi:hypothetical protein